MVLRLLPRSLGGGAVDDFKLSECSFFIFFEFVTALPQTKYVHGAVLANFDNCRSYGLFSRSKDFFGGFIDSSPLKEGGMEYFAFVPGPGAVGVYKTKHEVLYV